MKYKMQNLVLHFIARKPIIKFVKQQVDFTFSPIQRHAMGKTCAYILALAGRQVDDGQRHELTSYANREKIAIDEFIEVAVAGRNSSRQNRINTLMDRLEPGDALLVADLSRLGRSTGEVISLLNRLIGEGVNITIVKEDLHFSSKADESAMNNLVNMIARLAELEQHFVSQRMKQALAAKKAEGVTLGKPRGTIQASIYDKDRDRIQALLKLGVSQRRISKTHLGYGTSSSLGHYIRTRGLQRESEPTAS